MKINQISSINVIRLSTAQPAKRVQSTNANSPSFKSGWNVDILGRNASELRELGEYFHKKDNEVLKKASKVRGFLGFKDVGKSQEAYHKLKTAVEEVVAKKNRFLAKLSILERKEKENLDDVATAKEFIQRVFLLNMIKGDRAGMPMDVTNGILLYGSSDNKDDFVNWLTKESKLNYQEVVFDKCNPDKFFQDLKIISKNAVGLKSMTKERTLLHIKNLDELLTNFSTIENRSKIAKFKIYAEHCAKDYFTTIIATTSKSLDDFEEASIAPHRFGIQLKLDEHLTKADKFNLLDARKEIDRLDSKADRCESEFYDEPIHFDDSQWESAALYD